MQALFQVCILKNICPISEFGFYFNSFLKSRADVNINEIEFIEYFFFIFFDIFVLKKVTNIFLYILFWIKSLEKPETLAWTGIWVGINVKGFLWLATKLKDTVHGRGKGEVNDHVKGNTEMGRKMR